MKVVKKQPTKNAPGFPCPECGLVYDDKDWAKQCEAWCKAHNSCNLAITKHARR